MKHVFSWKKYFFFIKISSWDFVSSMFPLTWKSNKNLELDPVIGEPNEAFELHEQMNIESILQRIVKKNIIIKNIYFF